MGQADLYRQAGELQRAEEAYAEVLELEPEHAEALYRLGEMAVLSGDSSRGAGLIQRAISIDASRAYYHYSLGCALHASDWRGAIAAYRRALDLEPGNQGARMNLGCLLQERGELEAAWLGDERAAQYLDEASAHFRAVHDIAPGNPAALLNLGYTLERQLKPEEALRYYERALALEPELAEARFNRSMLLLAQGRFREGWQEYEWRWKAGGLARPVYPQAEWDGSPLGGGTVLLYTEQGFGDAIQFIRYAAAVAARGARVLVRCPPQLQRLFETAAGVSQTVAPEQPLPDFEAYCALLDLPRLLAEERIPADVPYLRADDALAARWRMEIGDGSDLRIGLVWASQTMARIAPFKCVPPQAFAPLSDLPGTQFYSLQKGEAAKELEIAGAPIRAENLDDRIEDFADTAAVIENLDLTITVDTAVAHLAGAMGKPVWTLLPYVPDWRWYPDADSSRWYPGMRLYRQSERGNWKTVLERVAEDLQRLTRRAQPDITRRT